MIISLGRSARLGLLIGIVVPALTVCLLLVALLPGAIAIPTIHAPFPNATLVTESIQPKGLTALEVTRRYESPARYRDAVQWYQGKDSLMPVAATARSGCFQQTFRGRRGGFLSGLTGGAAEEVTVCSIFGRVTIESVTIISIVK
ncbi:MAG: hypothetical protein HY023_09060 [Chloroflexi bacterium]|nr:hypothetical protein [Chloroflexota bacterium]